MERDSRKRAEALLAQMTATEKVGQLNQHLYGFRIYHVEDGKIIFTQELKDEVKKWCGIGTIYGLYRADPWSEKNYETGLAGGLSVQAYNQLQKYVIEHSRLGIPFLLSSECPHGHQALDGYLLPVNLAVGASFDPALYERAGQVCGRQLKQMGVDFALVSALDILRDPRWGRSEECYGEDPYLSAELARAIVTGIQKEGVAVVAKHFCAQGETTGGVNASAARIGERELWEIHLQAAKACCEAGVKGIMAAYNEIDGKFCHANRHLLQDILREQLGFDGVVMADGIAIDQLDIMTGDNIRSAALALKAGVDISLWDEGYTKLEEALKQGFITEKELDQAVLRVLTLKFEQGLMDKPYIDENGNRTASYSENGAVSFPTEAYQESEKLARESVVLLKNENVLPIGRAEKIALIGPNADDIYRQIGDYSPPMDRAGYETLKSGMEKEFGADRVRCYNGHEVGTAVSLAENADIIVLALGGSSSRFKGALFDENGAAKVQGVLEMDCGEGMDTARLQLPGNQNELFTAVCALKKPVISVVIAGRPYAIPEIAQDSDALLYAFYPGPMGGKAIAELLSGKYAPSGRLPVSLPRNCGQLPQLQGEVDVSGGQGQQRFCLRPGCDGNGQGRGIGGAVQIRQGGEVLFPADRNGTTGVLQGGQSIPAQGVYRPGGEKQAVCYIGGAVRTAEGGAACLLQTEFQIGSRQCLVLSRLRDGAFGGGHMAAIVPNCQGNRLSGLTGAGEMDGNGSGVVLFVFG